MSEGTDTFKRVEGALGRVERIGKLIRDLGFPIFVAAYFLLSLGPKFDALQAAVDRLVLVVDRIERVEVRR